MQEQVIIKLKVVQKEIRNEKKRVIHYISDCLVIYSCMHAVNINELLQIQGTCAFTPLMNFNAFETIYWQLSYLTKLVLVSDSSTPYCPQEFVFEANLHSSCFLVKNFILVCNIFFVQIREKQKVDRSRIDKAR